MKIALACTGHRGIRCLQQIAEVAPDATLAVFSHPGEAHEPDYYDELIGECDRLGAEFYPGKRLKNLHLSDALFCVGWRYMVPRDVYEPLRLGAWVFHDSLLPALRGFSPTVWAVRSGMHTPGVTLFRMTEEVDAGPVVGKRGIRNELAPMSSIVQQVTDAYLALIEAHLPDILAGAVTVAEQNHSCASYCPKWTLDDLWIDWRWGAPEIERHVRAFGYPYPGARTLVDGEEVRVMSARAVGSRIVGGLPGRVAELRDDGAAVLCGDSGRVYTAAVLVTATLPAGAICRLSQRLGR